MPFCKRSHKCRNLIDAVDFTCRGSRMQLLLFLLLLFVTSGTAADITPRTYNRKMKTTDPKSEFLTNSIDRKLFDMANAGNAVKLNDVDSDIGQARDSGEGTNRSGIRSDYRGIGIDSHHSIDLQTWNKQHPPVPGN